MKCKVNIVGCVQLLVIFISSCGGQRDPAFPLNANSFQQIYRSSITVPSGRFASVQDTYIRFYGINSTTPTSYRLRDVKSLLVNPNFVPARPTVVYAHGYVEYATDPSVMTVVRAYQRRGGYNVLVLDWANMAFGNYLSVTLALPMIGKETSVALSRMLKRGLSLEGLHLVGHSLGAHLMAHVSRLLAGRGRPVPRLTGLDPAYPGFYPSTLGEGMSASDAVFVDALHTDGGGYGAPARCAHADYWPNEGRAKQPGCLSATLLLTTEDFCSHWRSWAFWAESVTGGEFLARPCQDYDAFLRGECRDAPLVYMGLRATPDLRGNFYLRTAAKEPYALGERGTV